MPFASTELAARIEKAGVRFLDDCAVAIASRRTGAEVLRLPLAGGIAICTGPDSPLNKLAGLGFEGALAAEELAYVERAFAQRGVPLQAEVAALADPAVVATLAQRGYEFRGFENVLGRALARDDAFPVAEDITVELGAEADQGVWIDTVVTGFAHPDTQGVASHESFPRDVLEREVGDMAAARGLQCWLARRDDAPAGGASLRLGDGVAQLCGASTLPAHRRRGVQTALLFARLRAAAEAGCDIAVVTTQPGSSSQRNVQRMGFELLYSRAMLVLAPG